ncbi:hypothetical protein Dsin_016780 [Dipteronia sinensis]|uniref:Uncharacterized protein n=1 Tax=Dipteronia sinensis TaxID=43782 RepID=A0AAE0E5Y3_9ROSI|nr:hypothetical protein Dsin_016780 [Dipteronia sinensis]
MKASPVCDQNLNVPWPEYIEAAPHGIIMEQVDNEIGNKNGSKCGQSVVSMIGTYEDQNSDNSDGIEGMVFTSDSKVTQRGVSTTATHEELSAGQSPLACREG